MKKAVKLLMLCLVFAFSVSAQEPAEKQKEATPATKVIASFEKKNPFSSGTLVEQSALGGTALRIDTSFASLERLLQDWSEYDMLKADFYTEAKEPLKLYVEIRDKETDNYWTRVNYDTVVPPGKSTFILPIKLLYVGEKSRPGRNLMLNAITRLVFSVGEKPEAPLYINNIRLEKDNSLEETAFEGLKAFDFGTNTSPVMPGFTKVTTSSLYKKENGFGFQDAKLWRAFDVLQPDPLYQDSICVENGNFTVDLPNGKYRVFLNIDNPSGFWGEYQAYKTRRVFAQGNEVSFDSMDLNSFRNKYFKFWNTEDLPTENTFDKYQKTYYKEKEFEVEVRDGQLKLGFEGENFACSLSCVIIFPAEKMEAGNKFLYWVESKRRFFFDNYFKRILHTPTGDPVQASAEEVKRGFVAFPRDIMKDLYYNDTPFKNEIGKTLSAEVFAGEYGPLSVGVRPSQDLGMVTAYISDLTQAGSTIPASAVDISYISYRITRVTMDGSVYTLRPRYLMAKNAVLMPKDITRQFWLTVKTPADAKPGIYKGKVTIRADKGGETVIPVEYVVRKGALDPLDIPAGPWGGNIGLPFKDEGARQWEADIYLKSLKKLREYGFTFFSGQPRIEYKGFVDGKPVLDYASSDKWMKTAKELGFLAVNTYGAGLWRINPYYQDDKQMAAAGFTDYSEFIKAIYTEIQKHADEKGWLPVYYNLGDENTSEKAVKNAEAYSKAFPKGPPYFTAAFSFSGTNKADNAYKWSKALHVAGWGLHDEDGTNMLRSEGGAWGFYNGGNRWTYGDYLYKAAKQFDLKYRISWHWNIAAGNPYYALDCREDDYSWCNSSPDGELVPNINQFERQREGLGDYRRLLTLARLCKEQAGSPAAAAGEKLIADRMASFKLGEREHDKIFAFEDWKEFRAKVSDAIDALRK